MMQWHGEIHEWLTRNQEKGIRLLQQMVQARSIQGNEGAVQQLVANELERMNLTVEMWEPDGGLLKKHAYFSSSRQEFSGSPNVVGIWKGGGEGRSIILNGHVDVVPAGDPSQWHHDSFSGKVEQGKMFGRGVTDMKGGNLALLLAIQALQGIGIHLQGDVIFQSVVEEESGGVGTLSTLVEKGYHADAALIPEPTSMRIFPKQQGSMWFRLIVAGRSAHAGTRYEGVSAIEKAVLVIKRVHQLEGERNERVNDPLYANIPIPIPINIGVIRGGDWPSNVPDQVILEGRMGVIPGETIEQAQQEMVAALHQIDDPWLQKHPVGVEWFGARWVPGEIDLDHEFMQILIEQYETVTKTSPTIEAAPWGTDGGLLTQVGGIPTIVFGPGETSVAHFPNEYIELERVFQVAEIIALTLIQWCGVKKNQ